MAIDSKGYRASGLTASVYIYMCVCGREQHERDGGHVLGGRIDQGERVFGVEARLARASVTSLRPAQLAQDLEGLIVEAGGIVGRGRDVGVGGAARIDRANRTELLENGDEEATRVEDMRENANAADTPQRERERGGGGKGKSASR